MIDFAALLKPEILKGVIRQGRPSGLEVNVFCGGRGGARVSGER